MRRVISMVLAVACWLPAWSEGMVSNERHTLVAGVSGTFSFNHTDNECPLGLYREAGVFVSYSYRAGDFYFNPEMTLYYDYLPNIDMFRDGPVVSGDFYGDSFGGALGLYIGRRVWGPISLFTGPHGKCNFYQGLHEKAPDEMISTGWHSYMRRACLQWRFGVSADVWRLRIRVSYDQHITQQFGYGTLNALAVSVGYKF